MPGTRQPRAALTAALVAVFAAGIATGVALMRRRHRTGRPVKPGTRGPVTQATVRINPADSPIGPPGRNTEERLDEGIQETFPASDPVSVKIE